MSVNLLHTPLSERDAKVVELAVTTFNAMQKIAGEKGVELPPVPALVGICAAYVRIQQSAMSPEARQLLSGSLLDALVDPASCLQHREHTANNEADDRAILQTLLPVLNGVSVWALRKSAEQLLAHQRKFRASWGGDE